MSTYVKKFRKLLNIRQATPKTLQAGCLQVVNAGLEGRTGSAMLIGVLPP